MKMKYEKKQKLKGFLFKVYNKIRNIFFLIFSWINQGLQIKHGFNPTYIACSMLI
jgi:hypothetical protein